MGLIHRGYIYHSHFFLQSKPFSARGSELKQGAPEKACTALPRGSRLRGKLEHVLGAAVGPTRLLPRQTKFPDTYCGKYPGVSNATIPVNRAAVYIRR